MYYSEYTFNVFDWTTNCALSWMSLKSLSFRLAQCRSTHFCTFWTSQFDEDDHLSHALTKRVLKITEYVSPLDLWGEQVSRPMQGRALKSGAWWQAMVVGRALRLFRSIPWNTVWVRGLGVGPGNKTGPSSRRCCLWRCVWATASACSCARGRSPQPARQVCGIGAPKQHRWRI